MGKVTVGFCWAEEAAMELGGELLRCTRSQCMQFHLCMHVHLSLMAITDSNSGLIFLAHVPL